MSFQVTHQEWREAHAKRGQKAKLPKAQRWYARGCCESTLDAAVWVATRHMTSKQILKRVERALARAAS